MTFRIALGLVAVLGLAGCPDHAGPPPATPIVPMEPPKPPPGPPVREPVVEAPAPKAEPKPVPTTPQGLTRSKVGDQVEFAWTRINGQELSPTDQAAAMAMLHSGKGTPDLDKLKEMAANTKPQLGKSTGTVVITRTEPESPLTFRVDIKQGKDSGTKFYAYAKDIPLHEVEFHSDTTDPRKKMKVAGVERQVVEKESRILAPDLDALALSGGMVLENSPEESQGAVSVTLTKFGTTKSVDAPDEPPKSLDTFEAPITVAMQAISKFGIIDPEEKAARDVKLSGDIERVVQPCMKDAKPASGALQGSIINGQVESLMWAGGLPPKPFEKCLREKMKKLKLPKEETFLNVSLGDT